MVFGLPDDIKICISKITVVKSKEKLISPTGKGVFANLIRTLFNINLKPNSFV